MRTDDFDYPLPPELIAQRPLPRGESRLLVLPRRGDASHHTVGQLPRLLRSGDLLVVNDTRVLPARLFALRRPGGARIEVLLVERRSATEWHCLLRPARKAPAGTRLALEGNEEVTAAVVGAGDAGGRLLRFSQPLEPRLDELGHVPLPPYIRRPPEAADRERYQTIFAREPGAIAAPTAGLHFSEALVAALREAGVEIAPLTLHVGLGTFRPVAAERVEDHRMDPERYAIPEATAGAIEAVRRRGGRVVAVGTTAVRALETAGRPGGTVAAGPGESDLFITPGFAFRVVDLLLTNFHLPRSTLLMLVAAFGGRERVLAAYREAVTAGYRFYSYGDAMLLERADPAGR